MKPSGKAGKTYPVHMGDLGLRQDLIRTGLLSLVILSLEIVGGLFFSNMVFNGFGYAVEGIQKLFTDPFNFFMVLFQPVLLFSICTVIIRSDVLKGELRAKTTSKFIGISSLRFLYILPLVAYFTRNVDIGAFVIIYLEIIWSFIITPVALLIAYRKNDKVNLELQSLLA